MITKVIVYRRPEDGGVSVFHPDPSAMLSGESEDLFLYRLSIAVVPPGASNVRILDRASLPGKDGDEHGDWREAWTLTDSGVVLDALKCRTISLRTLREKRNAVLDLTDRERARLEDVGTIGQRQQLRDYRQALRDLPASVQSQLDAIADPVAITEFAPTFPTPPTFFDASSVSPANRGGFTR